MAQFGISTNQSVNFCLFAKLLVSATLIAASSVSQAAINMEIDSAVISSSELQSFNDFGNPNNYCDSTTKAQTNHPKRQSTRQRAMDCMQTQLKSFQQPTMNARQQYLAYKAQAWLNYAYFESSIKSKTKAGDYALRDGENILRALKSDSADQVDLIVDIPETSALMRPDLWAQISALKDSGGIESAPRELAFSEVGLVWAAADYCQHGFRQPSSQFRMADRWLGQAREAYVNAHDSLTSRALEDLTVSYFKHYKALDPTDDVCRGQSLPLQDETTKFSKMTDSDIANISPTNLASTIPEINPAMSYSRLD